MCLGEIYVDDIDNPKTSLIVSSEGYYLAGDENNTNFNEELRELFDIVIIPQKIEEGEENISLNYHPTTWEHVLEKMLEDRFPHKIHGYYYKFRRLGID